MGIIWHSSQVLPHFPPQPSWSLSPLRSLSLGWIATTSGMRCDFLISHFLAAAKPTAQGTESVVLLVVVVVVVGVTTFHTTNVH